LALRAYWLNLGVWLAADFAKRNDHKATGVDTAVDVSDLDVVFHVMLVGYVLYHAQPLAHFNKNRKKAQLAQAAAATA
jgi:hypothetical protein